MKTLVTLSTASLAALALACGGPAHPKLEEIEETYSSGGSRNVDRWILEYSDNKLTTVKNVYDGTNWSRADLDYSGDKVDKIAWTSLVGSLTAVVSFDYDGDNLASYSVTWRDAESSDSEVILHEFDYDRDDRVERETTTDTETYGGSSTTWSSYAEYEYDNDGRLERITDNFESSVEVSELDYDDDGLLDDIIESGSWGSTSYTFSYNDDNRLRSVRPQGSSSYAVEYNDDNRIESVERTDTDGDRRTTRYEYGDGDITQFIPTPDVAWGDLFDMEGERIEEYRTVPGLPLID